MLVVLYRIALSYLYDVTRLQTFPPKSWFGGVTIVVSSWHHDPHVVLVVIGIVVVMFNLRLGTLTSKVTFLVTVVAPKLAFV